MRDAWILDQVSFHDHIENALMHKISFVSSKLSTQYVKLNYGKDTKVISCRILSSLVSLKIT